MELRLPSGMAHLAQFNGPIQSRLPHVFLIHGAGSDHTVWRGVAKLMNGVKANMLAPDLPGHGASGGKPLDGIVQMGTWILSLAEALDAREIVLAGHSMGSLVALEAAAQLKQRVTHTLLIGSAIPMTVNRTLLDAAAANDPTAVDIIMRYGHGSALQPGSSVEADTLLADTRALLMKALDGTLFADLNACNGYDSGLDAARAITCPVDLIVGEEDRMTPVSAAESLMQSLNKPARMIVPGCGHMLLSENPAVVARALTALLPEESLR